MLYFSTRFPIKDHHHHSIDVTKCIMGLLSEWRALLAVAVVVVIFDLAAIFVCFKTRNDRRKSTTALMISLLISDVLFGAVLIPIRIVHIYLKGGTAFLYIYAYLLFLSAFNALFLSFDRYACVIRPLWRRLISTRTIAKGLFVTWLSPAFISLLPLTWSYVAGYQSQITKIYSYVLLALLCFMLLAVVLFQLRVLCGLYTYWSSSNKKDPLRKTQGDGKSQNREEYKKRVNSTVLFLCLITTSVITWLPTIIYNISPFPELTNVSLFALMVNAIIDPLLIIGFNTKTMLKRLKKAKEIRRATQTTRSRIQLTVRNQVEADEPSSTSQV